jgi:hypothetical protein
MSTTLTSRLGIFGVAGATHSAGAGSDWSGGNTDLGVVVFGEVVFGQVVFGEVVFGEVVFGEVVFGEVVFGEVVFGNEGAVPGPIEVDGAGSPKTAAELDSDGVLAPPANPDGASPEHAARAITTAGTTRDDHRLNIRPR